MTSTRFLGLISIILLGTFQNPLAAQQPGFAPPVDSRQITQLSQRMAERVRILGEDAASSLAGMQGVQYFQQDVQELALSLDDFSARANGTADPNVLRQQFRRINIAWSRMRGQLLRPSPGVGAAPGIDRSVARVDELDNQIEAMLGLNPAPDAFYGQGPAPTGMTETQRLAHALADRALALSSVVRAEMINAPNGNLLVREADDLARATDRFHDGLMANAIPVASVPNQLAQIVSISEAIRRDYATIQLTLNVANSLGAYQSVESILRQQYGLNTSTVVINPSVVTTPVIQPVVVLPPANLAPMSDQLLAQIDDFLRVFSQTAGRVPEGRQFLEDASRLRNEANEFRNAVYWQANIGQLAHRFRDVDTSFQRLARRTDRIAKGRSGPNIQQIQIIGQTCGSIHQLLGMPGFPAQLPGFTFP